MVFTVRLDDETEELLDRLSAGEGVSRSEIVRRSIHALAEQKSVRDETNPYEAIKHLIGVARGGPRNLSERTGERFREILTNKGGSRR